jgi:hypothetical protein
MAGGRNAPARRQERRGWPLCKGASPRPEKRADIAKKKRPTQHGVLPSPRFTGRGWRGPVSPSRVRGNARPLTRLSRCARKSTSPRIAGRGKKRACEIARILGGAGYAVVPAPHCEAFFAPPTKYRGDGAPSGASFGRSHVPFPARGASRRAIAASLRHRAALPATASSHLRPSSTAPFGQPHFQASGKAMSPAVSELLAAGHSARGRSPGAARELGGCVHPPPAGAASDPTFITPHDSALGGSDDGEYSPVNIVLSSAGSGPV